MGVRVPFFYGGVKLFPIDNITMPYFLSLLSPLPSTDSYREYIYNLHTISRHHLIIPIPSSSLLPSPCITIAYSSNESPSNPFDHSTMLRMFNHTPRVPSSPCPAECMRRRGDWYRSVPENRVGYMRTFPAFPSTLVSAYLPTPHEEATIHHTTEPQEASHWPCGDLET